MRLTVVVVVEPKDGWYPEETSTDGWYLVTGPPDPDDDFARSMQTYEPDDVAERLKETLVDVTKHDDTINWRVRNVEKLHADPDIGV